MRKRLLALSAALLGVLLATTSTAAAPGEYHAPRQFYLALGDSLAYGFQRNGVFNAGYVDDLSVRLVDIQPGITTINFGCPGETTDSFVVVHCTSVLQPHDNYAGPQLTAALAFLQAHTGHVSPITFDMGGNDLNHVLAACLTQPDIAGCVRTNLPGALAQVAGNLNLILGELRAAAPRSEIIVLEYYNPFALYPSVAALTTFVVGALNATIAEVASAHGARLADAFQPFNITPPPGGLCPLVWACVAPFDIHPTSGGYQLIADQFWAASGYGTLD